MVFTVVAASMIGFGGRGAAAASIFGGTNLSECVVSLGRREEAGDGHVHAVQQAVEIDRQRGIIRQVAIFRGGEHVRARVFAADVSGV